MAVVLQAMVEVHKVAMVVHQVGGPLMVVQDPLSRLLEEAVGLRKVVVEGEELPKLAVEELHKVAVEGEVHRGVVEVLQGAVGVLRVVVGDQWDLVQQRPMQR